MSPARKPETLASIAGLSPLPGPPDNAVLLVIDGQLEYTVGRLPLAGIEAAVEEGARLLSYARSRGIPVFHAIHHSRPGVVTAATVHAATLAALSDRFSVVVQDTGALSNS